MCKITKISEKKLLLLQKMCFPPSLPYADSLKFCALYVYFSPFTQWHTHTHTYIITYIYACMYIHMHIFFKRINEMYAAFPRKSIIVSVAVQNTKTTN